MTVPAGGSSVRGMSSDKYACIHALKNALGAESPESLRARLRPELPTEVMGRSADALTSPAAIAKRWRALGPCGGARAVLGEEASRPAPEVFARNIENYIGQLALPVGVVGPLRMRGTFAHGDFRVPLATTEAALVASCQRGALALTESGGCVAATLSEGVSRSPGFVFRTLPEACEFAAWVASVEDGLRTAAEATTRHGRLTGVRLAVEGTHVWVIFDYTTGDAAGQNMVTVATQAACEWLLSVAPVRPLRWYVEANLSGDKKASALSFQSVRGRKVCAEAVIPREVLAARLQSDAVAMTDYWRMSALGSVMSGAIGAQGHYANPLAALYLATGQDAACVSESAVGVTRFEVREDGALYASVMLPNIIVGTVGGGTGLPAQRACLEILGLAGAGRARALAEVAAGLALAGELSIIAALAAGHFTRAHAKLARGARQVFSHE